jgi:hypothetical protein
MAMSYPRILKGTSILLVSALIGTASVGTASILTVTNTNDSGVGSLRNAILTASAGDTIDFNISGTGPFSIALLDPVAINEPLFINGASQPGYGGTPLIDVGLTTSGTPFTLGSGVAFDAQGLDVMPAVFTVLNPNDSGPGSLRNAILNANDDDGVNLVDFDIPGTGPHTIDLVSSLPAITDALTLDGTSQPGYAGTPLIDVDTSDLTTPGTAFTTGTGGTVDVQGITVSPAAVPEPSTFAVVALTLAGAVVAGNRTRVSRSVLRNARRLDPLPNRL